MSDRKYDSDALMALVEGTLPADEAAALEARVAEDPALAREYAECIALCDALGTLGSTAAVDTPEIDILDAVTAGVDAIKSGARTAPLDGVPDNPEVIACLESGESPLSSDDAEVAEVQQIWNDLELLGDTFTLDAPRIDITESALERLGEEEAQVADDLHALGDLATSEVPRIDIVSDVMAAVAEAKDRPENVVPFRTRPKPRQSRLEPTGNSLPWFRVTAVAAAALIIFALGFASRDLVAPIGDQTDAPGVDRDPVQQFRDDKNRDDLKSVDPEDDAQSQPFGDWRKVLTPEVTEPTEDDAPVEKPEIVFAKRPGVSEIFNARRAAMIGDEMALASLADWAALSPEEALRILEESGYSPETVLGAIPFLSSDDAIGLLQGAVGKDPSNPQLRAALAENLLDSGRIDEVYEQYAQWSAADPTNGLPAFLEAEYLFSQGEVAAGLAALENASAYGGVDTYSQERARQHEQALRATGMDPDSATALAAVAANDGEYTNLAELGQSLLNQGHALAAQGDYAGAISSYKAALELGQQVQAQTTFMNEAQAAVLIQQEAINALNQISTQTALSDDMLRFLSQTNQDMVNTANAIGEIVNALNDLFTNGSIDEILNLMQGLMNGDSALSTVL